MPRKNRFQHRLARNRAPSVVSSDSTRRVSRHPRSRANVLIECGWGRLIFGQTFDKVEDLVNRLRSERTGQRDIAIYLRDPHVAIALAPQEVFLDPSHTFRLWFDRYQPAHRQPRGFHVRLLNSRRDAEELHNLYLRRHMVPPEIDFVWQHRTSPLLTYLVAVDDTDDHVVGAVAGVDHVEAFEDPELGSSLWALAVDPQASHPGIGEALVRQLVEHYQTRTRSYLDLSVMHDNHQAIGLYEKLGFERVPVFTLKRKNSFNEPLYTGSQPESSLNPYATIIVREAQRRGIFAEAIDPAAGYFELTYGGRSIVCRESLSELTSAVAMSRCDDKAVTHRLLEGAGLRVPAQTRYQNDQQAATFLRQYQSVVVKPARGEQGAGISVDVRNDSALSEAIVLARRHCDDVLLEEFVAGEDLRIIVIDFKVVAAAVRRPPQVVGNGRNTVRELIEKQSRRRAAATEGESTIPIDRETERCCQAQGYELSDTPPEGDTLRVRNTANLHTGGTIHDVTAELGTTLANAAVTAAKALQIPVTGLDFMVPDVTGSDYVIIEANERPGLANHEPQPTAERFVDLLFPQTARTRPAP